MIKLVAMDMDGTLLDSAKTLPLQNKQTIEAYASKGTEFAFCTGRVMSELQEFADEIPAVHYAITCNGSYVRDLKQNKEIYSELIPIEEVRRIYKALKERGTDHQFELMADGVSYAEKRCIEHPEKYGTVYIKDLIRQSRVPVEDMEKFLAERKVAAGKINVFYETGAVRDQAEADMQGIGFDLCHSEPTNLEITKKGINKGMGLLALTRYLGYSIEEVMAIGDNYNDIDLLKTAGCSVVMENAPEDVKQFAEHVTLSNDEMGVSHAIKKFCQADRNQ